jgi:hypothetical protein
VPSVSRQMGSCSLSAAPESGHLPVRVHRNAGTMIAPLAVKTVWRVAVAGSRQRALSGTAGPVTDVGVAMRR